MLALAGATLAGCTGGPGSMLGVPQARDDRQRTKSPIKHVVIIVQENRTFNDFFATYSGADGTTVGQAVANSACSPPIEKGPINLAKVPLLVPHDLDHQYRGYKAAYHGGKMDAFDTILYQSKQPECAFPYQYTDPSQIRPYWSMAQQYALAEHMFTTQGSDSFTAHQDLIRGGTIVEPKKAMVDLPTCGTCFWGCDAPPGTQTHLITKGNHTFDGPTGPFPCSNRFSMDYPTIRDLLDAKAISWKYYQPPFKTSNGKLLSAFDAIYAVRYGSEWSTNVVTPQTAIFADITAGTLPNVSWVIPDQADSDHPGDGSDTGPQWVASIVNAIGESSLWDSTAIVIVWDDWGGLYDNDPPKQVAYGGLGFRVPAIVVSPYAKAGYISKTNYEFGSILRYVEDNWNLGRLKTSDTRAASIIDCFDYSQTPITFEPIESSLKKEYFIRRAPSLKAPDTDF
jgi:phospholipase C